MEEHKNEPRGPRFDPHWRHFVVSLSKLEKLVSGMLNLGTNKINEA